ncbi:serine/threonine-protein kinase [Thermocoleostomius sinensis]|uniref:Serine/threonine-protein kinase n=1 Tax=Thermocoleostomius sinensis A174 TaxID=2016057 RepID=A0A9E9C8P1_9CYAN|nr:serine/threonine-protein kinase [Thermocoleostomius sinensis]WAL58652.1 serine/threonine-protein kinase [Thermocoleostomius sinensis A174]
MSSQLGIQSKRSNYRLLGLVGQGQFGRVFCAVHRQTGQIVALKELDRQRFSTHKFLRELRFLLSLQHPNIVNCQALEHTPTGRYLVMDYCHGGTLRKLMAEDVRVGMLQSLKLVADILQGLDHAHSHDIIHCDIKPENILLNVEPNGWTARISDFGVARLSQESVRQALGNTGSPAYMAPERFYGQYSPTSDLYAVGVLLFELLAGYRPFSGTPADLMSAHLNQPLKIPETIPAILHPLITTALQKLSARRFQTAQEMLAALQTIVQTSTITDASSRLLQLTSPQPVLPLQAPPQAFTHDGVTALAIVPPVYQDATKDNSTTTLRNFYICHAQQHQIHLQLASDINVEASSKTSSVNSTALSSSWSFAFKDEIRALLARPQGCFVATLRSLYLVTAPVTEAELAPQLIYRSKQEEEIGIDLQGQWLATLTRLPATNQSLQIWQLTPTAMLLASSPPIPFIVEQSIQRIDNRQAIDSYQLLVLDSRHIAVIVNLTNASQPANSGPPGSLIIVMTRRGTVVGTIPLPIWLGSAWLTANHAQIVAIDRLQAGLMVLIDLKPYRLWRLNIGIQPTTMASIAWGYVVADAEGNLMFFDRQWHQVGHLLAPAPVTAITFLDIDRLLLATWNGQQGTLQILNVKEAPVELLF